VIDPRSWLVDRSIARRPHVVDQLQMQANYPEGRRYSLNVLRDRVDQCADLACWMLYSEADFCVDANQSFVLFDSHIVEHADKS
jgi:hypothetical protein